MKHTIRVIMVIVFTVFLLAACGQNTGTEDTTVQKNKTEELPTEEKQDHSSMNHSSSGEVPADLEKADNPEHEIGSKVIIEADHMKGMQGAVGTISGAYDTTVYSVTYTPTTGGEQVENHKWVIHEEIEDPSDEHLEPGTEVTLNASHMEGMDGASAVIDSAEETTVYMVDFTPTDSDKKIKNHKWVTEDELSPSE